ncbi:bifunctional DNA primase/polymerase [Streptomyces sp. NPDC008313]|uniref:bifunctional DNA primase/polymerase n=1 Tax=Streptomyces sp. NPDC008313 TaxID=3364826 RepID=UPI0036E4A24E
MSGISGTRRPPGPPVPDSGGGPGPGVLGAHGHSPERCERFDAAGVTPAGVTPAGVTPAGVTSAGAAWLSSAETYPRSTLALWQDRPAAPLVLPCGTAFDVLSAPAVFGRRMLDRLWEEGPGSGPVATHRGRMLLFAAPGTAQRLPALLRWEEGDSGGSGTAGRGGDGAVPPLLCHGRGDAVTVPALNPVLGPGPGCAGAAPAHPGSGGTGSESRRESRWLVAPDTRQPWLPGAETMMWAAVRASCDAASATVRISIFPPADQDAKVYDVSRRR